MGVRAAGEKFSEVSGRGVRWGNFPGRLVSVSPVHSFTCPRNKELLKQSSTFD